MAFEVGATLVMIGVAAGAASSGSAQVDEVSSRGGSAAAEASGVAWAGGPTPPLALQAPAAAPEAPDSAEAAPEASPPRAARKPAAAAPSEAGEQKADDEEPSEADEQEPSKASAEPGPLSRRGAGGPAAVTRPAAPAPEPSAPQPPAPSAAAEEPSPPAAGAGAPPGASSAAASEVGPGPAAQDPEPPPASPPASAEAVQNQTVFKGAAPVAADKGGGARVQPQNALPPGQIAVPGGFSLAVGTQLSFGQSTFQLGSSYARDPMVDWSVSLAPSLMFSDGTRLSAGASLSQELTQANGDDEPHTFILSDIGLNLSRSLYRFAGGPQIFGALSAQIPTSESSRVESLITSLGARLSASQPVGGVFISLGSGFRKNFHEYTHPVRDPNTGERLVTRDGLVIEEVVTGIARFGGSELAGATYFDGESNNTSMIWSNSLSAFWPATQKLGIGISYNLSHSWTYESYPLDELSGVGARAGRGRRDSHGGGIFANYQALDELAFGLGMATGGPTRTADDKRIRFPFFNLEGPESNMTTFFISATYTQSVSL